MIDPIPELKREAAAELVRVLEGWRPTDLQFFARIDRSRLSDLRRGKLERFSLEALIRLLAQMQHRVELRVVKEDEWQRRLAVAARRRSAALGRGVSP